MEICIKCGRGEPFHHFPLYLCVMCGSIEIKRRLDCARCPFGMGGRCKYQRIPIVFNLTQHEATSEQIADGVIEPRRKEEVKKLLTFEDLPAAWEIQRRAEALADLLGEEIRDWIDENIDYSSYPLRVRGHPEEKEPIFAAMIGGAPFLMGVLETVLIMRDIIPLYAFSKRVVEEHRLPDGTIEKIVLFKHQGFIILPGIKIKRR